MKQYGEGAVKVPCPGLMELVEADDSPRALKYLQELFTRYPPDGVDAVVLGCTHYVFLKDMIRKLLPERYCHYGRKRGDGTPAPTGAGAERPAEQGRTGQRGTGNQRDRQGYRPDDAGCCK
jgi:Glutamate racemase